MIISFSYLFFFTSSSLSSSSSLMPDILFRHASQTQAYTEGGSPKLTRNPLRKFSSPLSPGRRSEATAQLRPRLV